ncbi:FOG: EAL domain [Moorella thermoacetica Y72]|uniref:FOG: EAL domain n=2 Tax=Neomoorella thermoacetica TaxID=1525 RepID=A0A0S6UG48_NEOTH|nr:FOG: EAL domain [Moorella thermoacetica Y72]
MVNMSIETLVDELASLPPGELKLVLEMLEKRLLAQRQVALAEEIIERYRPALEELAQ